MKQRITALLLALGLTVGLAACTGGQTQQTPAPDPTQDAAVVDPAVTDLPDKGTPPPEVTHHPDDHDPEPTHHPDDHGPEPTHHPDDHHPEGPVDTPMPTPTPAETPAPDPAEPSDTPSIANSAANVYAAVSAVTGSGNLSDMSEVMDQFYNISTDDLEDFVFYMPAMNATIEEIFIGRAKSGKVDAVKAACQSRLDGLKEDGEFYPDTGIYLDGAKLEVSGDWVILAVCDKPGDAVKAFKDAVK